MIFYTTFLALFGFLVMSSTSAFAPMTQPNAVQRSSFALNMGLFDAFSKAFENTEYGPPAEAVKATARHILVPSKEEAQVVMKMIASGEQSFESCAKDFSTCPSRNLHYLLESSLIRSKIKVI